MISSKVLQALKSVPDAKRYVIALSGGLDSALLLKSFRLAHPSLSVIAIHIHHGLSPNADAWANHCEALCESLSVPCYIERVSVVNSGEGIEAAARKARYAVFEEHLVPGDVLLQGHHKNDQAETVLLRALRGSSVKGLSAIPVERGLSNGAKIYRPWLNLSRNELEEEAAKLELEWVEDESNSDDAYDRNFIRQNVLPLIEERWPKAVESLVRVAENASEAQGFIEDWCARQFESGLQGSSFDGAKTLEIESLQTYSVREQNMLLRAWIESLGFPQPSSRIFERIRTELIPARADASPIIQWEEYELRRFDGEIYCSRKIAKLDLPYQKSLSFPYLGSNAVCEVSGQKIELNYDLFDADVQVSSNQISIRVPKEGFELELRSRSGGESIKLYQNRPGRSLKSLFKEAKVPPWLRETFPLVYVNGVLAAVGVRWRDANFGPKREEAALTISFSGS